MQALSRKAKETTMSTTVIVDKTNAPLQSKRTANQLLVWIRRVLLGLILLLVALGAIGAIYQVIATARDARAFPPPGQLVDVGGHKLHIHCLGTGSPTVILEAGQGGLSSDWIWIQPEIAKTTRVCAYDRAGVAWSTPGPAPRDAQQIVRELHTLLENAQIPGPYLLVGHSYGGLYVRVYAATYPEAVGGLVLIDAAHPDQWTRNPTGQAEYTQITRFYQVASLLTRLGMLRLLNYSPLNPDLPAAQSAVHKAMSDTAQLVDTATAEFNATVATNAQVRAAGSFGALPLVVLTATEHGRPEIEPIALEMQRELTQLSTNSVQRVVEGATHSSFIIEQQDAQVTVDALQQGIEAVRTGKRLASQ
jgi:pimeloyl-ACP methyl ester carboxylesterase